MLIPETVICSCSLLPDTECLLLLPGAVIGAADDTADALLRAAGIVPVPGAPVREYRSETIPAAHLLAATAERLDAGSAAGVELLKQRLADAIALADGLGVREMSFLSLPTDTYSSRLFALMTVFFRVLMDGREQHPCLERIRFFCHSSTDAAWIARVYNFYYPGDKSERMTVPE